MVNNHRRSVKTTTVNAILEVRGQSYISELTEVEWLRPENGQAKVWTALCIAVVSTE